MVHYDDFASRIGASDYDNRDLTRFYSRQIGSTADGFADTILHSTAGQARAGDVWAFDCDISIDTAHGDLWLFILRIGTSGGHIWRASYGADDPLDANIVVTGDEILDVAGASSPQSVGYSLVNQDSSSSASHSVHVHAVRLAHATIDDRAFPGGDIGREFFD